MYAQMFLQEEIHLFYDFQNLLQVNSLGKILVADTSNHRIQKFNSGGFFVNVTGANGGDGTPGSNDEGFDLPMGIASSDDLIYVADTGNQRIKKYDNSFIFLDQEDASGTAPGQFITPIAIAVNSTGFVFVVDSGQESILVFDSSLN